MFAADPKHADFQAILSGLPHSQFKPTIIFSSLGAVETERYSGLHYLTPHNVNSEGGVYLFYFKLLLCLRPASPGADPGEPL